MSTAKAIDIPEPSDQIETVRVEIRGRKYTFRELKMSEYDKLFKQATKEEPDADGEMQEVTDTILFTRLMILKSCVEPKLTADDLNEMGSKLYRAISSVVNELHYTPEPIKQLDDEPPASDEETPKGNG